jgi:hypothetical protein
MLHRIKKQIKKFIINTKQYETGRKASEKFMKTMPVVFDCFLPK